MCGVLCVYIYIYVFIYLFILHADFSFKYLDSTNMIAGP